MTTLRTRKARDRGALPGASCTLTGPAACFGALASGKSRRWGAQCSRCRMAVGSCSRSSAAEPLSDQGGGTEGLMAKLMAARDRWAKMSDKAPSIAL
jgi:hypothetical protein